MAERKKEFSRGGKQIVHLDFANFIEVNTALAAIEYARLLIARYPPSSVRTLTDVTNSRANEAIVTALKGLTKANKPDSTLPQGRQRAHAGVKRPPPLHERPWAGVE